MSDFNDDHMGCERAIAELEGWGLELAALLRETVLCVESCGLGDPGYHSDLADRIRQELRAVTP